MADTDTPLDPAAIAELIERYERVASAHEGSARAWREYGSGEYVQEVATLAAEARHIARALRLAEALREVESRLTLHNGVEFLYVVDGYDCDFTTDDDAAVYASGHGETLVEAIFACIAAATQDARDGAK